MTEIKSLVVLDKTILESMLSNYIQERDLNNETKYDSYIELLEHIIKNLIHPSDKLLKEAYNKGIKSVEDAHIELQGLTLFEEFLQSKIEL